jgi:hypothetical protein
MAGRNGAGIFTVTNPDFVSGTTISSSEMDANFSDVATGITQSIAADGQTTITGNIPMSNFKITGLGAGTATTDAINKGQLDAVEAGLFWKAPVVNATTANVSLTGEQTIDGILTSASRILVKDQTAPAENGIYVTAAGAWARATDMDTWAEVVSSAVQVSTGSTQSDTSWNCTSDAGGTLNTTAITFVQWGGLTSAGTGLIDTAGVVSTDFASIAEVSAGTSAVKSVNPDALAGSIFGTAVVPLIPFDSATACAVGNGAGSLLFRVPSTLNGMNLVGVAAAVGTAGTTGTMDIQIANVTQAADMLTTKITIDSAETDSSTAATPAVIDAANDDVATGDQLRIDVDAIHTTPATGLMVELQFRLP